VSAMAKAFLLMVAMCIYLRADVRYVLRCEMESSDQVMAKNGVLADAVRNCTTEVLQAKGKQLTRTARSSQIYFYETEEVITLDHGNQTWTKSSVEEAERASQAALAQLKQMGAVFRIVSNPRSEGKEIGGYPAKGMVSVLDMSFQVPGLPKGMSSRTQMEFWASEAAPGGKEIADWTRSMQAKGSHVTSPTLRMMTQFFASIPGGAQVLKDAEGMTGQVLELTMRMETQGLADTLTMRMTMRAEDFDTKPIPETEFAIPAGYKEVK